MSNFDNEPLIMGRRISYAPRVSGLLGASLSKSVLLAVLLCLWEGVPFSLIGLPNIWGLQIFSLCIFLGVAVFIWGVSLGRRKITRWESLSIVLFFVCIFSSFVYSTILNPQPLVAWVFALYSVAPILGVMAFRGFGCRLGDAIEALYWTGLLGSVLLIVDQALGLGLLRFYERGSAFSSGRVVFFKLESTLCFVIATIRLAQSQSARGAAAQAVVLSITFYTVFIATESRLAILAIALAMPMAWIYVMRGGRKFMIALLAPLFCIPAALFVAQKYLKNFSGLENYLSSDVSASWRQITIKHYAVYFSDTFGLGFGFMSANPIYQNILSFSTSKASKLYGVVGYTVSLDDIGIASALFQYGYAGLAIIILMTIMMSWSLFNSRRLGPDYSVVATIGIVVATFMISPISMNYFTLFYTAHIGGVLWFMAAEASAAFDASRAGLDSPGRHVAKGRAV